MLNHTIDNINIMYDPLQLMRVTAAHRVVWRASLSFMMLIVQEKYV